MTIVCGRRQVDVALPTAVRSAELLPGLLRLLLSDGVLSDELPREDLPRDDLQRDEAPGDEAPGDEPSWDDLPRDDLPRDDLLRNDLLRDEPPLHDETVQAHPWALAPIGGAPLNGSETLAQAGILIGDVLVLERRPVLETAGPATLTTRDRIEDVVNGQARFWGPRAARSLAQWTALLTAGVLLIPALNMPAGPASAVTAATVAVVVTLTAVLFGSARSRQSCSEMRCAAVGLAIGCSWAGLAGAAAFQGWATGWPVGGAAIPVTLLVAIGSALLVAGCAVICYPPALVHATALLVVGLACGGLVLAIRSSDTADAGLVAALVAVLLIGALPRVALATGGLTGTDPGRETAHLDDRITRADRVLIGGLIGFGLVAVLGVMPAALAADGWSRVLAVGIGMLMLLRSRTYSQTRHVIAPRIGGLLVFGAVWLGVYRSGAAPQAALIVGAVVVTAALTAVVDVLGRSSSPVGRARRGRILDLAEQFLVVALIVLTAWVVVLAQWVGSVIS